MKSHQLFMIMIYKSIIQMHARQSRISNGLHKMHPCLIMRYDTEFAELTEAYKNENIKTCVCQFLRIVHVRG